LDTTPGFGISLRFNASTRDAKNLSFENQAAFKARFASGQLVN